MQELADIEPRAARLTSEQVERALERYAPPGSAVVPQKGEKSPAGLAARLACDCGAFDYGPDDQHDAQRAFEAARRPQARRQRN